MALFLAAVAVPLLVNEFVDEIVEPAAQKIMSKVDSVREISSVIRENRRKSARIEEKQKRDRLVQEIKTKQHTRKACVRLGESMK